MKEEGRTKETNKRKMKKSRRKGRNEKDSIYFYFVSYRTLMQNFIYSIFSLQVLQSDLPSTAIMRYLQQMYETRASKEGPSVSQLQLLIS
jgi:hypothetical protein